VTYPDFAATVTAFFVRLSSMQDKTEGEFFLQRLRLSIAGSLNCPASLSGLPILALFLSSLIDVPDLGLLDIHGVPPRPQSSEGIG